MFRLILENNNYIHIEGFKLIKSFDDYHILLQTSKYIIEIEGSGFMLYELGKSDIKICGTVNNIKYTSIYED